MEKKVEKEVALLDLGKFVNHFLKKPLEVNELEKTYPDILEAIQDGFLTFDENQVPKYTLKDPILDDKQEPFKTEVNFKTRILPNKLADLAKGLHPQNEVFMLQLKMTSYIIGQEGSTALLDKFSRYDYDVIGQIASVFS